MIYYGNPYQPWFWGTTQDFEDSNGAPNLAQNLDPIPVDDPQWSPFSGEANDQMWKLDEIRDGYIWIWMDHVHRLFLLEDVRTSHMPIEVCLGVEKS